MPEITHEFLRNRLEYLQGEARKAAEQLEAAQANVLVLNGAVQDTTALLQFLGPEAVTNPAETIDAPAAEEIKDAISPAQD